MSSLPPLWPINLILVVTGGLAFRRWVREYTEHQRSPSDPGQTRLEGHRITLFAAAFGLLLPLLVLLYVQAPDWVIMMAGAGIVACVAGAMVLSIAIGWKRGGRA